MSKRVLLQPAYILHHRPYRDTSALLEVFAAEYGRISLIARGIRGPKSPLKGILQPFYPLLISWSGQSELMTLTQAELSSAPIILTHKALLSGLYLNELLVRILPRQDAHPELFKTYQTTLFHLTESATAQAPLRFFEKKLLEELGYALPLNTTADTHENIVAEAYYHFNPDNGFIRVLQPETASSSLFSGRSLIALNLGELVDNEILREVKRLMRLAINHCLGGKSLVSPSMWR